MTCWDVAGLARRDGERDPAKAGLHRIERCRLGVDRYDPGLARARDPAVEIGWRRHCRVAVVVDLAANRVFPADRTGLRRNQGFGRRKRRFCLCRKRFDVARCGQLALHRVGGGRVVVDVLDLEPRRHALGDGGEFHRLEKRDQRLRFRLVHGEILGRHGQFGVRIECDELQRNARVLGVRHERLAALGLLDLARAAEQRFEIAIDAEQLRCCLHADARHAWHVVDAVAGQRLDLDDLVRRHAEAFDHLGACRCACFSSCRGAGRRRPRPAASGPCPTTRSSRARRPPSPRAHRSRSGRRLR